MEAGNDGDHSNCIFCKIIAGQIPAIKVYEDDKRSCVHGYRSDQRRPYTGDSERALPKST